MATPFPAEIELDILLRLPAKSLRRFILVSKSWHSLITSPCFISSFHHRSSINPKLLLLCHPFHPFSSSTHPHFSLSSHSFQEHPSTPFTPPPHHHDNDNDNDNDNLLPRRVELMTSNSVNGIIPILLHSGPANGPTTRSYMYLWHLPFEKLLHIPPSDHTGLFLGPPMVRFYSGFGYDVVSDDYKIVRVAYLDSVSPTVEVFSMKEFCWRKLVLLGSMMSVLSDVFWGDCACVFVDGVGYWGAFRSEMKDMFFVLGFSFGRERFEKVCLPQECVNGRELRYQSLWVYKGLLAVSVLRFAGFESKWTRQNVWVRTGVGKVEWSKLFVIDMEGAPRRPVAEVGDGRVVMLGEGDGEHVVYDPKMGEVKRLEMFEVDAVVPYVESLASLCNVVEVVVDSWIA